MPIGTLNSELRDKKDHFVITLYKEFREKLNITSSSIILFKIKDEEFIRIPNKDFHITIPKKFIKNGQKNVKIDIIKIWGKENAKNRKFKIFNGNFINIKSLIPQKTIFEKEIFVLDDKPYVYVWYSIGGGARHIKIKSQIDLQKISELIGFYFGDGNTSKGIRSFRINNCEPSVLNYCLDILEGLGIPRDIMKVQVIYTSHKENIDIPTKERCINNWSKVLKLKKGQIISVNKSKGKTESLKYGSARIFLDNSILVEILLNGVLKKFLEIVTSPANRLEKNILEGFLRGLAAAEGSVTLTKLNSLSKIGFSYNPHSDDLNLYRKIFDNLGVKPGGIKGNEL